MPPAEKPADGGKRAVLHGGICALSGAGEDDGRVFNIKKDVNLMRDYIETEH